MSMVCRLKCPVRVYSNTLPLDFFSAIAGSITVARYHPLEMVDRIPGLSQPAVAWIRRVYPSLSAAMQSDVVRLMLLHEYGGTYIDLDIIVMKPFPDESGIIARSDASACNTPKQRCIPAKFADDWPSQLNKSDPSAQFELRSTGLIVNMPTRHPFILATLENLEWLYEFTTPPHIFCIGPWGLERTLSTWIAERGAMPPGLHTIPQNTLIPHAVWNVRGDARQVDGGFVFHPNEVTRADHGKPGHDTIYGQLTERVESECLGYLWRGATLY
jgi:hypothetical protein